MGTIKENKGGQAPYGYKWLDSQLVHVPNEAAIYALVFDHFLLHQKIGTTTRQINNQGYRNRKGNEFRKESVGRMLRNSIARGTHRYWVTEDIGKGKKQNIAKEVDAPSIISSENWNLVQTILEENSRHASRPATQDYFIGKVMCECVTPLELPAKSSEYRCSNCNLRIKKEDLLTAFESQIDQLALPDSSVLDTLSNTSLIESKANPSKMLNEVESHIEKLFELHASDAINDDIFKSRFDVLNKRKSQLIKTTEDSKTPNPSNSVIELWNGLSKQYKRILVENIVDEIIITKETISFRLFPLFNFAKQGDI